jgi:hypothetical protein
MSKVVIAQVLGVVLIVIGVLGFFNQPLLMGLFMVDTMHNIIHILTGALALFFAMQGEKGVALYGKIFTIVYGLVTLLGLISQDGSILGMMMVNGADNVLHILLTLAFGYLGFIAVSATRVSIARN